MNSMSVLVVDDERTARVTTLHQLKEAGYRGQAAQNPFEALEMLTTDKFDVAITDLRMPAMDGLEFLQRLRAEFPDVDLIVVTAYGTVNVAVQAMHLGAVDFLTKPFEFWVLEARLRKLEEAREIRAELERLREEVFAAHLGDELVGESPALTTVRERTRMFSQIDAPVLVTGESGTGKELVARSLHATGPRHDKPFVAVGCGAIPRELGESEFFGHEKGAFTGAIAAHQGVFERAHRGYLLLDDVDDLALEMQAKILRVLDSGRFVRVGGDREIQVDVRVVATSKVDLGQALKKGAFREDLYYRLRVLQIPIPPLRERGEDILRLAHHFLARLKRSGICENPSISEEAARVLRAYSWPGNVRELRAVIEAGCVLSGCGTLEVEHLLSELGGGHDRLFILNTGGRDHIDLSHEVSRFEQALVDWAIRRARGNQMRAAEILNVPRTTLQSKLASLRALERR